MFLASDPKSAPGGFRQFLTLGLMWLAVNFLFAGLFFTDGFTALLQAWQLPEYSHGPLIPILSGLLFLRQLKEYPPRVGQIDDRWVGVVVIIMAVAVGSLGKLSKIPEIVAYAMILWVGGILLISFGWKTGKHFWPPVLHLVYMLPLPDTFYYKMSTTLQLVSSELGVWILRILAVPVFLEGNIIDFGVLKLHVAEACSGLRYLFPILSFSYIFAVLYRGPMWHKAVLLISAAPITILMNSLRIAVAGVLAQRYGTDWLEGFTHFFEGWVIFIACILMLLLLSWIMLRLQHNPMRLTEVLDLETEGLGIQAMRLRLIQPSRALITSAAIVGASVLTFHLLPDRNQIGVDRSNFTSFPRDIGNWRQLSPHKRLDQVTEKTLAADDYHNVLLESPDQPTVGLFMAWYQDQSSGGVHSPEICLPGAGWEIAWLERTNIASSVGTSEDFNINRAIVQKGEIRMMVFYWFEQKGRRVAWDFAAKMWLIADGVRTGRTDGGLVRLTTIINKAETDANAEARLMDVLKLLQNEVPNFMPE
ncbi:exosortase D (VPLPA-CTERM-specific) [Litoreibacter halocynthiae]|uniref:Exosortase D (VPLPA-CTERM-specific) n=1 Tax=Litoreibacter halocynthiae TaxID=1242689 RepID=A0A4R7LD40_9RHOB|nr:VPLPA-CTERM-specific exosortase XrtD [Litoreibacter halocynthiae]TDT73104.1 exosortase D (VPLPA-CTERM-specific) [Litoreibacter halocynthiae]